MKIPGKKLEAGQKREGLVQYKNTDGYVRGAGEVSDT